MRGASPTLHGFGDEESQRGNRMLCDGIDNWRGVEIIEIYKYIYLYLAFGRFHIWNLSPGLQAGERL